MKPYLLPLTVLLLVGCSSGATDGGTSTLQPLPTTGIPVIDTIPTTDRTFTEEQISFIDDVYFLYGATPLMSDDEVVQMGELWCQLMTDGMTADDVISRINEGAIDNDDAKSMISKPLDGKSFSGVWILGVALPNCPAND